VRLICLARRLARLVDHRSQQSVDAFGDVLHLARRALGLAQSLEPIEERLVVRKTGEDGLPGAGMRVHLGELRLRCDDGSLDGDGLVVLVRHELFA